MTFDRYPSRLDTWISTFLARQAVLPDENLVAVSLEEPFYINSGIVTKKGRQVYEDEQHLIDYLQEITKEM